ncbi:Sbal_3080 family lipoprotein [Terasakiella sp. A23]|uniref:Sbal_3080 family lipoprotein n=1 Tax=Terasakiella sp. FCG-A23 TaxID=3080561 RepID=UPI0029554CD1|nr:Sbal_3080 family lipoprotein [Terasakiella sp. A23]MDV7340121.1 Sbal_3080 family lipoprotein [Terasakiella sp. A23]
MKKIKLALTFSILIAATSLSACAIQQNVRSVQGHGIEEVCIRNNPSTKMSAYQPMLQRLIEAKRISTRIYDGRLPEDCEYNLSYTANWSWDGGMYLRYNKIDVFKGRTPVGSAEYKAGLMSLAKWGKTETKVGPLIDQLFPN